MYRRVAKGVTAPPTLLKKYQNAPSSFKEKIIFPILRWVATPLPPYGAPSYSDDFSQNLKNSFISPNDSHRQVARWHSKYKYKIQLHSNCAYTNSSIKIRVNTNIYCSQKKVAPQDAAKDHAYARTYLPTYLRTLSEANGEHQTELNYFDNSIIRPQKGEKFRGHHPSENSNRKILLGNDISMYTNVE